MSPNRFRIGLAASASLFYILIAYAGPKDFWETKFYTEWTAKEVDKFLLRESPWSNVVRPSYPTPGGRLRDGFPPRIIINWYSRPIREGVARRLMLNRPDTPKVQLDQILNRKSEYMEFLLTGYSLRFMLRAEGERALMQFKKDTCILKEDNTKIPLANVILDDRGGSATLQFAKEMDGKLAITAEDKEVTLQIPFYDHLYRIKFKLLKMMVRGQLEI